MSVQLRNLEIRLGNFHLGPLHHDWGIPGFVFIKGKNGSGKTTLLKALMGRQKISGGSIRGLPFPIGSIGVEPLLMNAWTVEENFKWFSQLLNRKPSTEFWNLVKGLSQESILRLSKGMTRQVELALILSFSFPTFLLDEVWDGLDEENRSLFQNKIEEAAKNSLVILSGHKDADFPSSEAKVLEL